MASEQRAALILMDIELPGVNGMHALRAALPGEADPLILVVNT